MRRNWTEEQKRAQSEKQKATWARKKSKRVQVDVVGENTVSRLDTPGIVAATPNGKVEILKRLIASDMRLALHLYATAELYLAK